MATKRVLKKRRAPLPEEVYPNIAKECLDSAGKSPESSIAPNAGQPRTLPLGEPVVERRDFASENQRPYIPYSHSPTTDSGTLEPTRKSFSDIRSLSDNEALDVLGSSEKVKALSDAVQNGRKRYSCGDVKKLRSSSSRSSLLSLNLSDGGFSVNSVSSSFSTDYVDSQMVDQEDIITLTVHVRKFSDALSKLRNSFSGNGSDTDSDEPTDNGANASEEMQVKAHECLGNVLSNLKEVINQYPLLHSKEILAAAGHLITKIKSHNYEENRISDDFYQSIDQLALVFSSSISDFLMGDQEMSPSKTGDDGDDVDEYAEDGDDEDLSEGDMLDESLKLPSKPEPLVDGLRDQEADLNHVLLRMESGVDFCLQWTKCWSKYVKDIANYVEKRAQYEAEFTKQLTKLAQTTRTAIAEENYLPFQSTFFTALDQDLDYSQRCQQTLSSISSKFMTPLMQRRSVHDRARKDMKDEWTKMCKQLHDSVNSVKTSKNIYHRRKQELEKLNIRQGDVKDAKDSVFGTNKIKKEEELRAKVEEAKEVYTHAVEIANQTQTDAEKTKERIVAQTKQLVNECDRTFRSVTRKYFDMMHDMAVPTPIHFKTLAESCQGYEPGKEFEEFIRFQQSTARSSSPPVYIFEQYSSSRHSTDPLANDMEGSAKLFGSPVKAWSSGHHLSDYEYGVSPGPSPSGSPQSSKKAANGRSNSHPPPSTDDDSEADLKEVTSKAGRTFKRTPRRRPKTPASLNKVPLSKNASTHTFHKIRSPAKCSFCDSYVFNGVECAQCGLSCHKKCLENLYTPCGHSRRRPSPIKRMKTFGVRFSEDGGVPVLVTKCVNEINRRGLRVKGIYRVSGVKSKMEGLCQDFEANADSVDLSTQPPHLIASVLKLYIRQLPEPLMTTKLYAELIQLAKDSSHLNGLTCEQYDSEKDRNDFKRLLEKLKEILHKLPRSNYLTTSLLIKHLHKVSIEEEHNQMSPQNLAIVFGPTILRLESENSTTSLSSLVDMPHQTRIVALLILNPQLFGDDDAEESKVRPTAHTDVDSAKNGESTLPDTPVEKFVSPKNVDEAVMPDLYGIRSNRVRGEGPSPMDKLQSHSSEENLRVDRSASRISERIDVKGEATVFDNTEISLPGSLEHKSKFLDWGQDDDDLSERETDLGQPETNIEQESPNNEINHPSSQAYISSAVDKSVGLTSTSPKKDVSVREYHSEENKPSREEWSLDFPIGDPAGHEDQPVLSGASNDQQEDDQTVPRRRSKAFSVGKRNSDPNMSMLAKRGSALMNAFIDANAKSDDSETSPRASPSRKTLSSLYTTSDVINSEDPHLDTPEKASEVTTNNGTGFLSSTVTSATLVKNETSEPETNTIISRTVSSTDTNTYDLRNRAATSGTTSRTEGVRSGDELDVHSSAWTASRKRSATYDSDRRRRFENRPEREEKRAVPVSDRVLAYGMRSRRHRVSVKDQIKQLEERGNYDSSRVTPVSSSTRNTTHAGNHVNEKSTRSDRTTLSDDNSPSDGNTRSNVNSRSDSSALTTDGTDGKNSLKDGKVSQEKTVRAHEPLSRVRVKAGHIDQVGGNPKEMSINTPGSPVLNRQAADEKFCALKMDICLESPRTPSPESCEEESYVSTGQELNLDSSGRGLRLNPWTARGLTPRDSNQAPEFV